MHILCTSVRPLGRPSGYRGGRMAHLAQEYAARAATFRRLAAELRNEDDRAALLAIAAEYEAEAARLKKAGGRT